MNFYYSKVKWGVYLFNIFFFIKIHLSISFEQLYFDVRITKELNSQRRKLDCFFLLKNVHVTRLHPLILPNQEFQVHGSSPGY